MSSGKIVRGDIHLADLPRPLHSLARNVSVRNRCSRGRNQVSRAPPVAAHREYNPLPPHSAFASSFSDTSRFLSLSASPLQIPDAFCVVVAFSATTYLYRILRFRNLLTGDLFIPRSFKQPMRRAILESLQASCAMHSHVLLDTASPALTCKPARFSLFRQTVLRRILLTKNP